MNNLKIVNFNIGNIGIKLPMQGFTLISDKVGSATHSHADFEYHYVFSGNATIKLDNEKISIPKDNSILVFPDTFHKFVKNDTDANILSLSFSIKKNKHGFDYFKNIEQKLVKNDYLLISYNPSITYLIKQIISTIYTKNLFSVEEMRSRLILFFSNIFSNLIDKKNNINTPTSSQEYDTRIYVIENYLNEHYMEKITLSELSKRLYLGEQQTDRMIKKIYGVGFRQRLAKVRIKCAMELLSETNKTITDIAEIVGYESYFGFYNAFKRITGLTPENWRNNFSKNIKKT